MADAFPQLVRCFESQWAGLTPEERRTLARYWAAPSGRLPAPCSLKVAHVAQIEQPIWTVVVTDGACLTLMSVKADYLGEGGRDPR
jgi:hypothetical protein